MRPSNYITEQRRKGATDFTHQEVCLGHLKVNGDSFRFLISAATLNFNTEEDEWQLSRFIWFEAE